MGLGLAQSFSMRPRSSLETSLFRVSKGRYEGVDMSMYISLSPHLPKPYQ